MLATWGFDKASIEDVSEAELAAWTTGPKLRSRPVLIKGSSSGRYLIDDPLVEPQLPGGGGSAGNLPGVGGSSGESGGQKTRVLSEDEPGCGCRLAGRGSSDRWGVAAGWARAFAASTLAKSRMFSRRRLWVYVAVGLVLGCVFLFFRTRREKKAQKKEAQTDARSAEAVEAHGESHPVRPRTAPRLAPRVSTPAASAVSSTSEMSPEGGARAVAASAPSAAQPMRRVAQLTTKVTQQAVLGDWVTVNDQGSPCPPQRLRILYSAPGNLKKDYKKGAYFEPLGPSPGSSTTEVNGLLICEGYPYLYRGFEAYYREKTQHWDVFPFPVIE